MTETAPDYTTTPRYEILAADGVFDVFDNHEKRIVDRHGRDYFEGFLTYAEAEATVARLESR
jgi:hypothetical protein